MSHAYALALPEHPEISNLVEGARELISAPQVHFALLEALNDPDTTSADIGEIISMDPSLTARLLRIVNSPYYGFTRRIDTITRAVTVVGTRDLFDLAVAVCAARTFARLPSTLVNMNTFWRHSVLTAMIARELGGSCAVLHPERMFVAGLLHDIGSLLLYVERPETMSEVLLVAGGDEELLYHAELSRLGFSHAELGGTILALWRLPAPLCAAVAFHHAPLDTGVPLTEPCLVYAADYAANRCERGAFAVDMAPGEGLDESALLALGVDARIVAEAVASAIVTFDQTVALFMP